MSKIYWTGLIAGAVVMFALGLVFIQGLRQSGVAISNVLATAILSSLNLLNIGFWNNVLPALTRDQHLRAHESGEKLRQSLLRTAVYVLVPLVIGIICTLLFPST